MKIETKIFEAREVAWNFKLDKRELMAIEAMTNSIPIKWKTLVQQSNIQTPIRSWVGCFETNRLDAHSSVIFQSNRLFRPILDKCSWALSPHPITKCFTINTCPYVL
jgi:hypothetical protein